MKRKKFLIMGRERNTALNMSTWCGTDERSTWNASLKVLMAFVKDRAAVHGTVFKEECKDVNPEHTEGTFIFSDAYNHSIRIIIKRMEP